MSHVNKGFDHAVDFFRTRALFIFWPAIDEVEDVHLFLIMIYNLRFIIIFFSEKNVDR
jgi:hypothetical protein